MKLNVIPQKHFKKLKLWHCTNIKIHLKLYRYPKQKRNEEMKEMITNNKKKKKKTSLADNCQCVLGMDNMQTTM